MKINLNEIDQTQFNCNPHFVNGETLWLVTPLVIGTKWRQDNKHLRSSLWSNDGELVSGGFPKFTNFGENPDHFPVPKSLKDCNVVEKLDGSLLIVSKYKGNYILRTRGTVDASQLDNGHELQIFRDTHLERLDDARESWDCSYLFEWVSPTQRIILNYGENPAWHLVGAVSHVDYSLWTQKRLDACAEFIKAKRPCVYTFPDVESLLADIEKWKGKEGVVIYSKNDQVLHKVKCLWYLALHRMKESLSSFDKVIDVWSEQGEPPYQQFEQFITSQFDFELWSQIRGEASRICDAAKGVHQIVEGMQRFVDEKLKPLPTRKEQALKVIQSYGETNRASFVFNLLDGKQLNSDDRKKLLYQVLKK
jgi:hypothetical protein